MGGIHEGHAEGFDGFRDFALFGEAATFGEPLIGSPMILDATGDGGEVVVGFRFGGIEVEETLAGEGIDPAFVVAVEEGATGGKEFELIEREIVAAEFGQAFDALLQTMERDAGIEEFHQLANGRDLAVVEVGEAIDLADGGDESETMPAADDADGNIEHLAEHGGGVFAVELFEMFLESEEVEPIGFGEDAEGFPLVAEFASESEFEGGLAVGFEGPAFLADDENGGLAADVPHGAAAVTLDELQPLVVGHGGERAGEGDAFPGEGEGGIRGSGEIGVVVFGSGHGVCQDAGGFKARTLRSGGQIAGNPGRLERHIKGGGWPFRSNWIIRHFPRRTYCAVLLPAAVWGEVFEFRGRRRGTVITVRMGVERDVRVADERPGFVGCLTG